MASAASNYNKTLVQIQKLANNSALSIQKMVNKSNQQQMSFNSAEAQKSRSWQEKMSKSAHQMEVEDLKKAGLNPVLSTNSGGAQSYTTSSASTQNDSGASASAAILSDQLGAMSNMESARMSADATLKAANQQAKATRYAAQQSAAAQMYSSNQAYQLGVYRAKLNYKSQQEERENARWITKNQTANSWSGIVDKFLRDAGIHKLVSNGAEVSDLKRFLSNSEHRKFILSDKRSFFADPTNVSKKNCKLSSEGLKMAKYDLQHNGFRYTKESAQLYVRAVVFRDKSALKPLLKYHYLRDQSPSSIRPGRR